MEQARHWMWTGSAKHSSTQAPRLVVNGAAGSPYDHRSWEQKAFAEDTAAAHLGGCVWPPRSYSCSFCRREFRSAQALGGHMNIHRRDRARLKQSPPPPDLAGDVLFAATAAEDVQRNPSRLVIRPQVISHLVFSAAANPNPNSGSLASPPSPVTPAATACTLLSPSFPSSTPRRIIVVPETKPRGEDLGSRESDPGAYDEEITKNNKRRKLNGLMNNEYINGLTPVHSIRAHEDDDEQRVQSQVLNCNLAEELDLELRLGDAPKIK